MELVMHSSESVRWWTPLHILKVAREALGGEITLDPASESEANERVRAERFYAHDGEWQSWLTERLFVNPPYDRSGTQWRFAERLAEREATHAVGLFRASVGSDGFAPLWSADVICFVRGRLRFGPDGSGPAPFDSVLVYFGPYGLRARRAFETVGVTVSTWK